MLQVAAGAVQVCGSPSKFIYSVSATEADSIQSETANTPMPSVAYVSGRNPKMPGRVYGSLCDISAKLFTPIGVYTPLGRFTLLLFVISLLLSDDVLTT